MGAVTTPTLSSGASTSSANDLFSAFRGHPAANSAPVSPYLPRNQWKNSTAENMTPGIAPSLPHSGQNQMPMQPMSNMNMNMNMRMSAGAIPTSGMNSAFFNSIASAPGQDNSPSASRQQPSGDPFSNLRNL